MIYLLWFFFSFIIIVSLIITKSDIFSPIIIFCVIYLISVTCAIYNINRWGINLHFNTFLIFIYGTLLFFIISIIIFIYFNIKKNAHQITDNKLHYITIKKYKLIMIYIYDFIVLYMIFYYINKIAFYFGTNSGFSNIVYTFRYYSAYNADIQTPMWINQLAKILDCSSYIFLYVFINNLLCNNKSLRNNLAFLIPIFATIFKSFLYGARIEFLSIIAASIVIYYILWNRKYNWNKKPNRKFYIKLFFISIITVFLFYFFLTVVGRKSEIGFLNYITNYAGGSIQLFDMFMQSPIEVESGWGNETFLNIHNFLNKIMGNGENKLNSVHLEYRYYNNINIGNVYTAYRSWIKDFGIKGMSILQIIFALFYNIYYYKIKCEKKYIRDNSNLVIYSYLINKLFLHSINTTFYNTLVSANFIFIIILYKLLYNFFIIKRKYFKITILKRGFDQLQWK